MHMKIIQKGKQDMTMIYIWYLISRLETHLFTSIHWGRITYIGSKVNIKLLSMKRALKKIVSLKNKQINKKTFGPVCLLTGLIQVLLTLALIKQITELLNHNLICFFTCLS